MDKLPERKRMETKYFPLGNIEKNRLINIMKVLFGIACIAVALYWVIFRINSTGNFGTIWITILFLSVFGFYQIWAGIGKAERYIKIGKDKIVLKKYIFLQPLGMAASETEKIEFFSLKVIFFLKSGRKVMLRFGTMYYESNETIRDEIAKYAEEHKIPTELIQEEI